MTAGVIKEQITKNEINDRKVGFILTFTHSSPTIV